MADTKTRKAMLFLEILSIMYIISGLNCEMIEYCNKDNFNPQCGNDELVVMKQALYGRMRLEKCISTSYGYLGCKSDVLRTMDRLCSNKESCNVLVHYISDELNQNPCGDLLQYLEADYTCMKVLPISAQTCRSSSATIEVAQPSSLSSQALVDVHCGSSTLRITAKPGQKLNISIIDFSWDVLNVPSRSCINYLELFDSQASNKTPVCAGTSRTRHVMATVGKEVTATFHLQDPTNQRFILQFDVIGCADISPPEGTWVRRDGDETTLGCHGGSHSWTLKCEHNHWIGAVGSCGTGFIQPNDVKQEQIVTTKIRIAPGMLVFAAFSLLLLLCSSTFTTGVCIYTHRASTDDKNTRPIRNNMETLPMMSHIMKYPPANLNETHNIRSTQLKPGQTSINLEQGHLNTHGVPQHSTSNEQEYINTTASQADSNYSDSVKYYVLENMK